MIWTFIFGIAAGWLAPRAEPHVKPLLEEHVPESAVTPAELRAVSLALCLLAAAVAAMVLASAHVLPLALGALLGVLGPRLLDKLRDMRTPDYD